MSYYTIQVRDIWEPVDLPGKLMDFPIFDEGHRLPLIEKVRQQFWMREIGQETPELYVFFLRRKLNVVMPLYNELYRSEKFKFDPLSTFDMSTLTESNGESNQVGTSSSSSDGTNSANARAVESQFPQEMLKGDRDYATGATDTISTGDTHSFALGENRSANTDRNTGASTVTGRSGSANTLLAEFRSNILNIDQMVLAELEPLHMSIWGNGDQRNQAATVYGIGYGYGYGSPFPGSIF